MLEIRSQRLGGWSYLTVLLLACSNEAAQFTEVPAGSASGAQSARAPSVASVHDAAYDARAADAGAAAETTDPVALPPSVNMDSAGTLYCGNAPCQCNNGIDDDGDGTIDGFDVECTGGLDDDESSFATGIPGDNRDPKWQDCFFDGNSGAGDDRCRYPTECLTGELPLDDDACAVTQACRDNCQPRTPNGCDCFGCCAVELPGGSQVHVTLGASCSLEKIGDAEACPPCSPNPECHNECGECELCPGKTADDLPAHCSSEPEGPAAPGEPPAPPAPEEPAPAEPELPSPACEGRATCVQQSDCSVGLYCSLGCCLVVLR